MKIDLQKVFIPVKVENEIPEKNKAVFCMDENQAFFSEIWFDLEHQQHLALTPESYFVPTEWLKEEQKIIFTKEEFNNFLEEFGKELLKVASENVKLSEFGCRDNRLIDDKIEGTYFCPSYFGEDKEIDVTKSSITEVLHQVLEQFKIK